MIAVELNFDLEKSKAQIKLAEKACTLGARRALERMGLFVEGRATQIVATSSGRTRASIHTGPVHRDPVTGSHSIRVGADSAYSLFIELGFTGHFVPFSTAPDLYKQALTQWGWRPPVPGTIKHPRRGAVYLVPRGRKSPVWGVFVTGKAQPFLRPALDELIDSGLRDRILEEEMTKALAELR
jgi:hypothetical protein